MLNFNLIVVFCVIVFYFSSIAQTNYSLKSIEITTDDGLIFEKEYEYRLEDNSYTDIIQLINLETKAQALQFNLLLNETIDDSTILIFQNIKKGSDLTDSSWILSYNVFRGDTNAIGASEDVVSVLLYNLNQEGGLDPGDYNNLLEVEYRVADLPFLQDSIKSSMKISDAMASTFEGFLIDITPSRDEFIILVRGNIAIPKNGLVFAEDTVYNLEDDSYTDIMQLKGLTHRAQALQFKLLVNHALDDKTILTFQNIQKGSDINDPSWILDYNVFRGPLTGNGASIDEIVAVLYNLNQNGGLLPGDYDDLLAVNYRVADLPALQDSIKSSIKISNVQASTYQGFPIDIAPSRDELIIIAKNRVGFYGDVNGDGCLDILDIILVVDHVVGRDSLDADQFERADIAPWIAGNELPDPDGVVNVQDLSLLQNIILTGIYPNGTPINGCSYANLPKMNGNDDTKVTIYINNEGIMVYLNPNVDIRGVQLEFGSVSDEPNDMIISTDLGKGYFMHVNELLRVLMYDRHAEDVLRVGENFLADIPFHITMPENITLEKCILIDVNNQLKVENQVEIIIGTPPLLPLKYILFQNYPNPFNPSTTIKFAVPEESNVNLRIYNVLGELVLTLVNEQKKPSTYEYKFNASTLASGVYLYRIRAGSFVETKKMVLLR